MSPKPSFSLVTEPWIQCQLPDGGETLLSLHNIFDGTTTIVGIRGDSPTQDYAVLRVLLAIYWRAHHRETAVAPGQVFEFAQWRGEAWGAATANVPDRAALEYLDAFADRLDLLHPTQPFMQVADLHTSKDTTFPVERIIPEAESSYFSMRAGEGLESLSLAEAARWLVHTQAYDYSGIKSGAVGDPRVKGGRGYPIGTGWSGMTGGTTVLGNTLRETLVLNTPLVAVDGGERDLPVWEREPDGPAERPVPVPAGAADLATWQSRRIRLFCEDKRATAVLVSNGDRIPDAGANIFGDPMTPYRFSKNKSTKAKEVFYPRPYETTRMMWRSLEPLIALEGDVSLSRGERPAKRPSSLDALADLDDELDEDLRILNIRITSASYGPQASSAATTVDARIDLPRTLLHEDSLAARQAVLDAARVTLDAADKLGNFAGNVLVAAGGDYAFQAPVKDALLTELEPTFRDWLRDLDPTDPDPASRRWQLQVADAVREKAQEHLRGAGPKALIGREITRNDRTMLVTAGTAYARLQRDLRKALPLTAPSRESAPPASADPTEETMSDD